MNAKERVMTTLDHREPDRVPMFDSFWEEFTENWRRELGLGGDITPQEHYEIEIRIAIADESPWPSDAVKIGDRDGYTISRDSWGRVVRASSDTKFFEELEVPVKQRSDLNHLVFESPYEDFRYERFLKNVERWQEKYCVFCKTGGPYLRTMNLRGTEQFLVDIQEDPEFVRDLVERVTEHLIDIGLEELRRGKLNDTGLWIYDDIGYNGGLMMSPKSYEMLFYPAMKRMCDAFKGAGCRKVLFHGDGDIREALDMLIDAGVDGINPVEPRAGMDVVELKKRYGGRLAYVGGLCNSHVLPIGTKEEIRRAVRHALEAGSGGGLVLGAHSIGPDIPAESYDYEVSVIREYGVYPLKVV